MPAQFPSGRRAPMGGQGGLKGRRGMRPRPVYFRSPKFYGRFSISGVTRDSDGNPLGSCAVMLFHTATDQLVAETVSDVNGNYSFSLGNNAGYFYVVAYKTGSPDVGGTSVNTIAAT